MPYVTVGEGNSGSIDLHGEDDGSGPPAVLIAASSAAAVARSATWETDLRAGLRKIDVPVLVVQGDADQAVPFEKTGERVSAYVSDVQLVTVSGRPHATRGLTPSTSTPRCCGLSARTPRRPPADRRAGNHPGQPGDAALNEHDVPPPRRHRPVAQEVTLNQDASRLPVRRGLTAGPPG